MCVVCKVRHRCKVRREQGRVYTTIRVRHSSTTYSKNAVSKYVRHSTVQHSTAQHSTVYERRAVSRRTASAGGWAEALFCRVVVVVVVVWD